MSNKLAKMRKDMMPNTMYTKDRIYGRVEPTPQYIAKIKEDITAEVAGDVFGCLMAFVDMAARETLGFGDYMADQLDRAVINFYEKFNRGDITMDQVVKYMKKNLKKYIEWKDEN